MPGKRNARARLRGSWTARLAGARSAVLLAGTGVAAYLILGGAGGGTPPAPPTRVLGTQAINLVDAAPAQQAGAGAVAQALLASHSALAFTTIGPGGAEWTADQMAGDSYIFIYLRSGLCLGPGSGLARCNLQAGQRWLREHPIIGANGLDYWQLQNMADGRCLTAGTPAAPAAASETARLEPCQASPGWNQLVAFLAAS